MELSHKIKHSNIDLTQGNPLKVIIFYTIPLLFGNLFQQFYNVVDSYIVGNYINDAALAAVSSSASLISLFISLFQGIAVGAGILLAQYFGAKEEEKMHKCVHTTVGFGIILGIVVTVIGVSLSPQILKWMNTPSEVIGESITYFTVYFSGSMFTIMYNIGSSILRAIGDSKRPLYYLIIASVINILLDLLFVATFQMGVAGAALATIISQCFSMILTYITLIKEDGPHKLIIKKIRIYKEELIKILGYGIPSGLQNSIISLSNVFIQSNINSFGPIVQAGCGSYQKIEGFATMPSGSFSMSLATFVIQNVGAKQLKRARKGALQGILLSMITTEIIGIILYIFAPQLISLFTDTPEVIEVGALQTITIVPFYFLLAFSHGMSGILRGFGKSKTPMFVMIICWCVVRVVGIPLALKIPGFNDITTIFYFYPLTWSISFIVLTIVFINVIHKQIKLEKENLNEKSSLQK